MNFYFSLIPPILMGIDTRVLSVTKTCTEMVALGNNRFSLPSPDTSWALGAAKRKIL